MSLSRRLVNYEPYYLKNAFDLSWCITIHFLSSPIIEENHHRTCRMFLCDIDDLSNLASIVDYSYIHSLNIYVGFLYERNLDYCLGAFE